MIDMSDFYKSVEKSTLVSLRQEVKSFIEENIEPKNIYTKHHIKIIFLFDLISETLFYANLDYKLEDIISYCNIDSFKYLSEIENHPYDKDFQFFISDNNLDYTSLLLSNLERYLNNLIQKNSKSLLYFKYKNYRGEIDDRKVIPYKFYKGSNEYHKEEQTLMKAYDLDKKAIRIFAVNDIINIF